MRIEPRQGRQARVPRQLRHDGPGRAVPDARPGRGAVATPRSRPSRTPRWLGNPPCSFARVAEDGDAVRTFAPAAATQVAARAPSSSAGCVPVAGHVVIGLGVLVRWSKPSRTAGAGRIAGRSRAGAARWRASWRPRSSRPSRSGCSSGASASGAPAVELVRVAQRAGRHLLSRCSGAPGSRAFLGTPAFNVWLAPSA